MPRKRLTANFVTNVKPPASGRVDYFDHWQPRYGVTFGLRVGRKSKSFCLFYRPEGAGRWQRYGLGRFDPETFTLADAHDEAVRKARELVDGGDPAADQRVRRSAPLFPEVADRYIEEHAKPRKRSWQLDKSYLDRDVKPAWKHKRIGEIRRPDVRAMLSDIEERGAPVLANRTLEVVRKLFRWAAANDVPGVEIDPTFGVEPYAVEEARDRDLTDAEIKALWKAYGNLPVLSRDCLRLIAVTGQRRGEVMSMREQDIDRKGRTWTIPTRYSKSKRPHVVPLTNLAWKIIAPRLGGDSPYLFPSPRGGGEKPIGTLQKAQEKARKEAEVTDATVHDWRRAATTRMAKAGVSSFLLARVLNHADSSVTGRHYNLFDYHDEKRKALRAWEKELRAVIGHE